MQLGMSMLSLMQSKDLTVFAGLLHKMQHLFLPFASKDGALFMRVRGVENGQFVEVRRKAHTFIYSSIIQIRVVFL